MAYDRACGVLLVAHGTVTELSEMEGFLTAIRRGRPPSAELVGEMCNRYRAIGGSPLQKTTREQAAALAARLNLPVLVGMRFGEPSVEQALADAESLGIRRLLILPMAPFSVELYANEVRARANANSRHGAAELQLSAVEPWGLHPGLIAAHAAKIRESAGHLLGSGAALVLSAHSLPLRVVEAGDNYAVEVADCAQRISAELGLPAEIAFQSQGADGGRWLGPTLEQVVARLLADQRKIVVLAPFGFLCDHVETLYDLDIELRRHCDSVGIELHRVPALGLSPILLETLAQIVEQALAA